MPRASSTSNPTGLREIDRKHVTVLVTQVGADRFLSVPKLDLSHYGLSPLLKVVCVARAGNTSQRLELGPIGAWDRSQQRLKDLDASAPIRFRLLIHPQDSPKLVATCENLRVRDDAQAESLLPMEPADLGEEIWRLDNRPDGPVILINRTVFPTAGGATAFPAFLPLVMPEVLRQVSGWLAAAPERMEDESDPLCGWGAWIDALGIDRIPPGAEADEQKEWVETVVQAFAARNRFATVFRRTLVTGNSDD